MSEEKIGMYTTEEIYEELANSFLHRSMVDAMYFQIKDLQQKVEQLEKENKELKQPQVFIDCEDMEERYGRDLYEDYLKGKIEQLENIRKEAIEYIKSADKIQLIHTMDGYLDGIQKKTKDDLLNILNKGSE